MRHRKTRNRQLTPAQLADWRWWWEQRHPPMDAETAQRYRTARREACPECYGQEVADGRKAQAG